MSGATYSHLQAAAHLQYIYIYIYIYLLMIFTLGYITVNGSRVLYIGWHYICSGNGACAICLQR